MKIDSLKAEAKRLGIRVTKKIKGKRVPLTEKELDMKIQRRQAPALEIQVRQTKKLLRTCKSLFKTSTTITHHDGIFELYFICTITLIIYSFSCASI